jgi:hypothetical protein
MLSAIQSLRRPTTPIARLAAELPDLPHPHKKRQLPAGVVQLVIAGLVALPIFATAVIFRHKLASAVSRADSGDAPAPDAEKE